MKKFISICLAVAMIFAVCTFSAFADPISTYDKDYPKYNDNVNYFYYTDKIEAEGTLNFNPATRTVSYTVSCTNISYDNLCNFHLWAQCAINYSDGSQDFDTRSLQVLLAHGNGTTVDRQIAIPSNKTLVSLDAEYQVWYEQDTLWEGQIYYPLTLGINA